MSNGPTEAFIFQFSSTSGDFLSKTLHGFPGNDNGTDISRIHGTSNFLLAGETERRKASASRNVFIAELREDLSGDFFKDYGSEVDDLYKGLFPMKEDLVLFSLTDEDSVIGMKIRRNGNSVPSYDLIEPYSMSFQADPKSICAVGEGFAFLNLIETGAERTGWDLQILLTDENGVPISERTIGSKGDDEPAQIKYFDDGFVYVLSTIDMQNANTLISLMKIEI